MPLRQLGLLRHLGLLTLLAGLIALVGCSDIGNPVRPKAEPALSTSELDFGTVAVSGTATRTITVSNTGSAALTGTAAISCAGYQLISGGGPFSIAPGGSRSITIKFSPGAVGSFPCTLDLGPGVPPVALTGSGAVQLPGALCAVLPDSIHLGFASAGQAGARVIFQVLSIGTAPLLVNIVSTSDDYRIVSGGGPAEIPPGQFIGVVVEFRPQGGRKRTGTIVVGPGCPEVVADGIGITISLRNDIRPILATNCAESCHYHYFNDPIDGNTYIYYYVVPLDTMRSYLYFRVSGDTNEWFGYPRPMPPDRPLIPQADQDKIRDWILEGAQNN